MKVRQHVRAEKVCAENCRGANQSCIEKSRRLAYQKTLDTHGKTYLCVAVGSFGTEYGCNSGFTRSYQYSHDGNLCEDRIVQSRMNDAIDIDE